MIIVTGGAGFIGSNLVKTLNAMGRRDIWVVDDLSDGHKFVNLSDLDIADYIDFEDFITMIEADQGRHLPAIDVIFHQGACADTTEWDGHYMMRTNYDYSKQLLQFALRENIPFIYASSASVYGANSVFREAREYEKPLNVYAYSKWLFDQYVRHLLPTLSSKVIGLRYFNVYGPRETHKGKMASVAYHLMQQLCEHDQVKLFKGSDGYADGEQRRDFVYVDDVVNVNLWAWQEAKQSGVFNVGSGQSRSFNDVARALIKAHGHGRIEYIDMPEHLAKAYQSFTQADLSALRSAGYQAEFTSLETGLLSYYQSFG
jgi:ADP-L-glycero-D-manno-heptose 6-epimerase